LIIYVFSCLYWFYVPSSRSVFAQNKNGDARNAFDEARADEAGLCSAPSDAFFSNSFFIGLPGERRSWAGQLSRKGAPNGSDSDVKASWAPERVRGFRAA